MNAVVVCTGTILVFSFLMGYLTGDSVRRFSIVVGKRRLGDDPREVTAVPSELYHPQITCAAECHSRLWCTGFNADHIVKQCELFDYEPPGGLVATPVEDFSYGFWTRAPKIAECGTLTVQNGVNVAKTPHLWTVNITCNVGFGSYYKNATCNNGTYSIPSGTCAKGCSEGSLRWAVSCYKVVPATGTFDQAISACAAQGGVLATILPARLRQYGSPQHNYQYHATGLKHRGGNIQRGWEWIDTASDFASIDIDSKETLPPKWQPGEPNYFSRYGHLIWSAKFDNANYNNPYMTNAFCQIAEPNYRFDQVLKGQRIKFPCETILANKTKNECMSACRQSVFCRALSYNSATLECHQHSVPPGEDEVVAQNDTEFNLYF